MHTTGSSYGGTRAFALAVVEADRALAHSICGTAPAGVVREYLREAEPTPADHKAAREARRREIDVLLREDARSCPAFAKARMRAVVAALEQKPALRSVRRWINEQVNRVLQPMDYGSDAAVGLASRIGESRHVQLVRDILAELHHYEAHRGGERRPRRDLTRWLPAHVGEAVEVYERSRGLA